MMPLLIQAFILAMTGALSLLSWFCDDRIEHPVAFTGLFLAATIAILLRATDLPPRWRWAAMTTLSLAIACAVTASLAEFAR